MEAAEAGELGILEARNGPEQADLLGIFQFGLEADHVPERAERIVLAKLDHGIRPAAGHRIVEADRFHRAVEERGDPSLRHHPHRHTAPAQGRVLPTLPGSGLLTVAPPLWKSQK